MKKKQKIKMKQRQEAECSSGPEWKGGCRGVEVYTYHFLRLNCLIFNYKCKVQQRQLQNLFTRKLAISMCVCVCAAHSLTSNQAAKQQQQQLQLQTGQLVRWAIDQLGKLSQELATAIATTATATSATTTATLLCNGLGRRHVLFMMYAYLCGIS